MYCDVYISYPIDSSFTYSVPDNTVLDSGMRVKVDFAGRKTTGYVHKIHNNKPGDFEVKDILDVIDDGPIFDSRLIRLAEYISFNYFSSIGEVLSLAVPSGIKPSNRYIIPVEKKTLADVSLTGEQEKVYLSILEGPENGKYQHLVFGTTGSGKTEIYIELAKRVIEEGKSVIYLVPEISLSSQIFERLYNVFGEDLIIYHSSLTPSQRLHNWKRFYTGEAKIAIGTRSSIFLQPPELGLVIIDEEHDSAYKENSSPRYSARRVAFYRSIEEKALLVLGSATPSVETLYAAERGRISFHRLEKRFGNSKLPEIEIVRVNPKTPSAMISSILKLHTMKTIEAGNQVIYLLNRRGFAPLMLCNTCGRPVECPHCRISMNYHRGDSLLCHYCGHKGVVSSKCSACGAEDMIKIGAGTQRIEELIEHEFNGFRIFRLDQDTARKKDAVFNLIEDMNKGDIDILIGTQLVAKGFHFENVTLVGVLLSDIGLNLPDFRASERIFSLLTQVAGRSGKGDQPGRVLIQTLSDEHFIYKFIKNHDYFGFYRTELETRKLLGYPPFSRLIRLLARGKDEERVKAAINRVKNIIDDNIDTNGGSVNILGPSSAPFSIIGGNYRYHLIIKTTSVDNVREAVNNCRKEIGSRDVYLEIDVDPYDLL